VFGTRRVIAGVNGSVRSLAALRAGAAQARAAGAELLPVLAWKPVGGEIAYARSPCPAPHGDIRRLIRSCGDAGYFAATWV